jgi:hypothetical protein
VITITIIWNTYLCLNSELQAIQDCQEAACIVDEETTTSTGDEGYNGKHTDGEDEDGNSDDGENRNDDYQLPVDVLASVHMARTPRKSFFLSLIFIIQYLSWICS